MPKDFGAFPLDDNSTPIEVGKSFKTADITGTPQTSPLSVGTSVVTIVVPTNAFKMYFTSGAALRVSEVSNAASYFTTVANTPYEVPCSGMDNVYVRIDAAEGTTPLSFYFVLV